AQRWVLRVTRASYSAACLGSSSPTGRSGRAAPRLAVDVRLIEHPQPRTVGLAARDLRRDRAVGQARRRERELSAAQCRLLVTRLEIGPPGHDLLIGGTYLRGTGCDLLCPDREHGVWFVEGDQSIDVAGVEPLDNQLAQVLRLERLLA